MVTDWCLASNADLGSYGLQSGDYAVSNIMPRTDGCNKQLSTSTFPTLLVQLGGTAGAGAQIMLGTLRGPIDTPSYSPSVYSQGTGTFSDDFHVTTKMATHFSYDSTGTCVFDLSRQNDVTVTGNNQMHLEFVENESNISPGCRLTTPNCTSSYAYDLNL
jgi:hypothetical protein